MTPFGTVGQRILFDMTAKFVIFADDTTILTSGNDAKEAYQLMNSVLSKIYKWFRQNKLNLNISKTR